MIRKSILIAAFFGAVSGVSAADSKAPNQVLGADALKSELFGVHLFGVETESGIKWDECIDPQGRTVYRVRPPFGVEPYSENGQLIVTDNGQACFEYPPGNDPEPACFRAMRRGDGYIFFGANGEPGTFMTTRIERGKTSCPNPGDLVG